MGIISFIAKAGSITSVDFLTGYKHFELSNAALDEFASIVSDARRRHIVYADGALLTDGRLDDIIKAAYDKELKAEYDNVFNDAKNELESYYNYSEDKYSSYDDYDYTTALAVYFGNGLYTFDENGVPSVDEDKCMQRAEQNIGTYKSYYNIKMQDAEQSYRSICSHLDSLGSVKYLLVDNSTGKTYTNSEGLTPQKYTEDIKADDLSWGYHYSSSDGKLAVSKSIERLSNYGITNGYNDLPAENFAGDGIPESTYIQRIRNSIQFSGSDSIRFSVDELLDNAAGDAADNLDIYFMYTYGSSDDALTGMQNSYTDAAVDLFVNSIICASAFLLAFIILLCLVATTGREYREGPVKLAFIDRIYNDIHFCLSGAAVFGVGALGVLAAENALNEDLAGSALVSLLQIAFALCTVGVFAIFSEYLLSNARHFKNHTLVKHTFVTLPIRLAIRLFKKIGRDNAKLDNGVTRQFKTSLWLYGALVGISAIFGLIAVGTESFLMFLFAAWLFFGGTIVAVIFLWKYAVALDCIRKTVEQAHAGNYDADFNAEMPATMRRLSAEIADMKDGMKIAVDSAVRDQRMKAELITNVSHDLKTPLTSVINYAGLIAKSDIKDETVREYVDVLIEKSNRLKQLIEDLIEATKASTGNIELHPVDVNLFELAMQALAENSDALDNSGVEARISPTELRPTVRADSQKTYRVIENLISNICKYSPAGSRAYVTVSEEDGFGLLTFKNISKYPLDIPAQVLTERFVRGDSSRSGEGSGLGLAIARDLCELQGGEFILEIDGDLFKATVKLPLSTPPAAPPTMPFTEQQ